MEDFVEYYLRDVGLVLVLRPKKLRVVYDLMMEGYIVYQVPGRSVTPMDDSSGLKRAIFSKKDGPDIGLPNTDQREWAVRSNIGSGCLTGCICNQKSVSDVRWNFWKSPCWSDLGHAMLRVVLRGVCTYDDFTWRNP